MPPEPHNKRSAALKSRRLLRDLTGGLLAAIVALPLCLAFGVASGLDASAGLYGAIATAIIAALFGGTPALITGPTGPVTVMVAAVLIERPMQSSLVFASAIAAGFFQIILAKLKTGQLIQYMPHPVISGFMTGIGTIIVAIQLCPLAGLKGHGEVFTAVQNFFLLLPFANTSALLLGIATIAIIITFEKLPLKLPPLLVALLAGTLASIYLNLDLPRIGSIPQSLPVLSLPQFDIENIHIVLASGFSIAVVASIDTLLTSLVVDKKTRQRHKSDRELFAQGLANIGAGLIGGIPCSGTTMPSMVNVQAGAKSYLSSLVSGLILLALLLGLASIASLIPLCVLAGILITVGFGIMDKKSLANIKTAPKSDSLIMLIVWAMTVFVDLMMAVAVGVALASTIFAKRMADRNRSTIRKLESMQEWKHLSDGLSTELQKQFFLYDFKGPLFFGEVKNFVDSWPELENAEVVILRFHNVPFIDQTGAYALEEAIERWQCPSVLYVGLHEGIKTVLDGVGIKLAESNCFDTVEDAINAAIRKKKQVENNLTAAFA